MSYEPPEDRESSVPPPMPPSPSGEYGYGAPTRPVGGAESASTSAGGLVEKYRRVVLSPSVEAFEEEIPGASWGKTFTGVAAVMATTLVVGLIVIFLLAALLPDLYDPNRQILDAERQISNSGILDLDQFRPFLDSARFFFSGWGVAISVALTPIFFLLGAGALYVSSSLFGGRGGSFMTHAYLLSLSYTPLRVVSTLAGLIPIVSGFVSIALYLYQLYLAGVSMQASRRMEPGKAMMAAFVPLIVLLLLMCVGIIALLAVLAPMIQRR